MEVRSGAERCGAERAEQAERDGEEEEERSAIDEGQAVICWDSSSVCASEPSQDQEASRG